MHKNMCVRACVCKRLCPCLCQEWVCFGSLSTYLKCRDGIGVDNNTRNAAMKKVMTAIFVLSKQPPNSFDVKSPLSDVAHYEKHAEETCALLVATSGKTPTWGTKAAPNTSAQAWANHYFVRCLLALCNCCCYLYFIPLLCTVYTYW